MLDQITHFLGNYSFVIGVLIHAVLLVVVYRGFKGFGKMEYEKVASRQSE